MRCHPERSEGPVHFSQSATDAYLRTSSFFIKSYDDEQPTFRAPYYRILPPLQLRPRPHHPRPAPLGNLQLRRPLDIDVGEYPDLYAGGQPDPGRHELEAGGVHGVSGQHDRADPDAA